VGAVPTAACIVRAPDGVTPGGVVEQRGVAVFQAADQLFQRDRALAHLRQQTLGVEFDRQVGTTDEVLDFLRVLLQEVFFAHRAQPLR